MIVHYSLLKFFPMIKQSRTEHPQQCLIGASFGMVPGYRTFRSNGGGSGAVSDRKPEREDWRPAQGGVRILWDEIDMYRNVGWFVAGYAWFFEFIWYILISSVAGMKDHESTPKVHKICLGFQNVSDSFLTDGGIMTPPRHGAHSLAGGQSETG